MSWPDDAAPVRAPVPFPPVKLSFLGAVTGVTGSQFLLETTQARVLIDCGMFQGSPNEMVHNRFDFSCTPATLDAVILTHAHLDHCGLLPRLVRAGFRGPIHATAGTVQLAALVLQDSGKLQQEAAKDRARWRRRHPEETVPAAPPPAAVEGAEGVDPEEVIRGQPPAVVVAPDEPLYVIADVEKTIPHLQVLEYDVPRVVAPGVTVTLVDAGHILGSAIVRLEATDDPGSATRTIVFSGDLGRPDTPILRDPTRLAGADYVVCESTYGGQEHEPAEEAVRMLADVVSEVGAHDGVLLVPSFAIGRTQELVWELDRLLAAGRIPALPLFLDSPMATKATDIYRRHPAYFDPETVALLAHGDSPLDYPHTTITRKGADSRAIEASPRPFMVVASSGMLTGGRILNHVREFIDDPAATLLFVGYQGEGTLGAHLQAGAAAVRIDGAERQVRCQVRSIGGFSAHADDSELVDWLGGFSEGRRPRRTFLVHGDPAPRAALAASVGRSLGYPIELPGWRETVELD
jgi:metallo-beta-lactamase family protein